MTRIRPIEKQDYPLIAQMVYNTWVDMALTFLDPEEKILGCVEESMTKGIGRLKKDNIQVIENKNTGCVTGMMVCYDGAHGQKMTASLRTFMEKYGLNLSQFHLPNETRSGEYYLDTLYILEKFRKKGYGTQLIQAAYQDACLRKLPLVLNVDQENGRAKKLYKRMGFQKFEERKLGTHMYDTMRKDKE